MHALELTVVESELPQAFPRGPLQFIPAPPLSQASGKEIDLGFSRVLSCGDALDDF